MEFNSISHDNNLNAIRYFLAFYILLSHLATLSGVHFFSLPGIPGMVGCFFTISGFLIFPSYEKRQQPKQYLKRRAERIFPPYFLIVLLAAGLGMYISTLSPVEYFQSTSFWKYLSANLMFLNFLAPDLPGVFQSSTNLTSAVNGSLWTMKGEVFCYLTVPIIFWYCKIRNFKVTGLLGILMILMILPFIIFKYLDFTGHKAAGILSKQSFIIFLFFMGGYLNHHLAYLKKNYKWIIVICGVPVLFMIINSNWLDIDIDNLIGFTLFYIYIPIATSILAITCGFTGFWSKFLAKTDISYDIYLFHYPIIQTFIYYGSIDKFGFFPTMGMIIITTLIFAWFCWKFIGSRFVQRNTLRT